jgi:hypothetical protein
MTGKTFFRLAKFLSAAVYPRIFTVRHNFREPFRCGLAIIFATFLHLVDAETVTEAEKQLATIIPLVELKFNLIFLPHYSTKLNMTSSRALFAPNPHEKKRSAESSLIESDAVQLRGNAITAFVVRLICIHETT